MNLLEKHILLNALIKQRKKLIKRADKINYYYHPQPNPETYKDGGLHQRLVAEYANTEHGKEEARLRQMAKDLKQKIDIYEQQILDFALEQIKTPEQK